MPRKVPQIYTDFTDFVLLLKNLCSSVKSVGLCGFGLKPILILPVTGRVILCEVHCGVCPKDDPIPSVQLVCRVIPVECVLLGE